MALEFKYNRLHIVGREFRLLEILPDKPARPQQIQCKLHTFSQHTCPPYVAVSYCWGDTRHLRGILLNGATHKVHMNAWLFLHAMRLHTRYRYIWIDAICINQSQTFEKSLQVSRIGEIYSNATEVLVWLGVNREDSHLAIDYITSKTNGGFPLGDKTGLHAPTQRLNLALQKLFTRPFWKRIWVVQEVMLAKQLTLFCGFKSFPWRQITDCIVGLETIADSGAQLSYELSPLLETPAAHLVQEKALWELQPPDKLRALPLKTLLEIYGGMEATHSVDKVYGLLGLSLSHCSTRGGKGKMGLQAAGAERRIRFPISYAKSVEAVYADVFRSVDLYQQREGQGLADPEIRDFNNLLVSLLGLPNPATQPNQKPLLLVEDHVSWMLARIAKRYLGNEQGRRSEDDPTPKDSSLWFENRNYTRQPDFIHHSYTGRLGEAAVHSPELDFRRPDIIPAYLLEDDHSARRLNRLSRTPPIDSDRNPRYAVQDPRTVEDSNTDRRRSNPLYRRFPNSPILISQAEFSPGIEGSPARATQTSPPQEAADLPRLRPQFTRVWSNSLEASVSKAEGDDLEAGFSNGLDPISRASFSNGLNNIPETGSSNSPDTALEAIAPDRASSVSEGNTSHEPESSSETSEYDAHRT